MFKFKNSRFFVVFFAILLALSVVAIYVPLLLPPQNQIPSEAGSGANQNVLNLATTTVSGIATTSESSSSSSPNQKVGSPSTTTNNLPQSLTNFQSDEKTLNSIQSNLNK